LLGPKAQAVSGAAITTADGVEIFDADAPLSAVMSPLSAFLSHASLEAGNNQAQAGEEALQLMTVHSAKGLEFDAVFITGLEEGLFPHENSQKEDAGVEEERRLMYVAITRAKERLYMSFSQTRMLHGQTRYNMRSRFFDELPEDALKWLSPKVQQHSWFANTKSAWDEAPEKAANNISKNFGRRDIGWRIGENVAHLKFGEGVIVNIEGSGGNARAHINFGKHGMKLLDLSVAKLEKVA
jgi:DNA helicase-2/ATP-dependent DNA helicase PcrA